MSVTYSNTSLSWLVAPALVCMAMPGLADTIDRQFTVSFGTQSISAPVRVSNVHPIASKMVTLPAVSCAVCRGEASDYTFDVQWISEQSYLDVERTNLVRNNGAGGSQTWVFRPSAYTTGVARNLETLVRRKGSMGGTACDTVSLSNDFYQCKLLNGSGNAVSDTELEVGILVTGSDVTPGDITTLDRALLTRVVTFKKAGVEVEKHRDAVKVQGSATIASCNMSAGSLVFNLPARAITHDSNNPQALTYARYGVKTTPPADGVRKSLRLSCVGNTELNIQFTPVTLTADQDRILMAKKSDGTDSPVGFQLWFKSSEWSSPNYQLVTWDNHLTGLLTQSTLPAPRPAGQPDIVLDFFASYAIESTTTLNSADAGPIVAKGLYTLSYQ